MASFDAEQSAQPFERAVGGPIPTEPRHTVQLKPAGTVSMESSAAVHATETLKVSTRSRPSAVAGAIAGVMRERREVDVQAIGAGATNQAIKAIAIAQSYLRDDGMDVCCVPSFIEVTIDGQTRTAVRLFVQQYTKSGMGLGDVRHEPR